MASLNTFLSLGSDSLTGFVEIDPPAGLAYRSMRRMALLIAACLVVASGSDWAEAAPKANAAARSSSDSASKRKSGDKRK